MGDREGWQERVKEIVLVAWHDDDDTSTHINSSYFKVVFRGWFSLMLRPFESVFGHILFIDLCVSINIAAIITLFCQCNAYINSWPLTIPPSFAMHLYCKYVLHYNNSDSNYGIIYFLEIILLLENVSAKFDNFLNFLFFIK